MTALALRRGTVVSIDQAGPAARLTVETELGRRPAVAYVELTGTIETGDDVVINVQAAELGLGSGGYDIVHANLTRGLTGDGTPGAQVMKLNYSSLQHAVEPLEERSRDATRAAGIPLAVIALHGQLAPVAWAAAAAGARVGYVQTAGGALPGALSDDVRLLREQGLLCGHVTAGACFGGEHEAISVPGALAGAVAALGWDAAIAGPGPGILGSATALGHGGIEALATAHAGLALGMRCLLVPRMSSADPRARHRGLSHHTRAALELLLAPVIVPLPDGERVDLPGAHEARLAEADLAGYLASGLPAHTMGRSAGEDPLFFRAALAGGHVLAGEIERKDPDGF